MKTGLQNDNQAFRKRDKNRRYRKRRAARRGQAAEAAVSSGELDGWTKFTPHHYLLIHAGQKIDYWPSTQRFMIRGDVRFGSARDAKARAEILSESNIRKTLNGSVCDHKFSDRTIPASCIYCGEKAIQGVLE